MSRKPTTNSRLNYHENLFWWLWGALFIITVITIVAVSNTIDQGHEIKSLKANLTKMSNWFEWECVETKREPIIPFIPYFCAKLKGEEEWKCDLDGDGNLEPVPESLLQTFCTLEQLKLKNITREVSYAL